MIKQRRIVFFDLDGTLHQQDTFRMFVFYLLLRHPLNILLVLLLLPATILVLLVKGRSSRWPMSLVLWGCTFGHSETQLKIVEQDFVHWFRKHMTVFPKVQECLMNYLAESNTDIWIITGSPQHLVELVYFDTLWFSQINLIATQINRRYGGWVLSLRCLGHEKVVQLEKRIGTPLNLYSGYSDSSQDNPLLYFCQHHWHVTSTGKLQQIK